ncbi:hypothetical protein CBM2586_B130414 [Cupriavidus phytorum]|uniref:Uncharacterized protein n=1 Tax=Cupriavidus taiwanensis TaxID=164546 RepID=A0A975XI45_9BURK|nr:hypothetical protein CBM2586_B130414 [Cupriavidus taiwanensis]
MNEPRARSGPCCWPCRRNAFGCCAGPIAGHGPWHGTRRCACSARQASFAAASRPARLWALARAVTGEPNSVAVPLVFSPLPRAGEGRG